MVEIELEKRMSEHGRVKISTDGRVGSGFATRTAECRELRFPVELWSAHVCHIIIF